VATQANSSASKKLRLFIALELPDVMKAELGEAQERLKRKLKFPLKWVRLEGIHLTLKFLGAVNESLVPAIEGALARAAAEHHALRLELGDLGTFGGKRPRVVWVGVGGAIDALVALQTAIDEATATLGFEPEKRAYSAHLTLARVPEGLNRIQYDDLLHAVAHTAPPNAESSISEVSLMQSHLHSTGATYTRIATAPLSSASP
jgi:2'-5' RNA ligase